MCNFGLIGNGRTHCLDKDECVIGANRICGNHTVCHNTHGSFYCVCLNGYRPSNNNKNFIPNDGTFCIDIDECEVADICGSNARCTNVQGSYECHCIEGYRLKNGTEPFHTYSDNDMCVVIDCGQPSVLPHSYIDFIGNTTFGSLVNFRCEPTFTANGDNNISVCTSKGTWEGANITCSVIECGLPPAIPNALIASLNSTTFGSNVTYTCMKGFVTVNGQNTAACIDEGIWEGATLYVKVGLLLDCGPLPHIIHASSNVVKNTTYGSITEFKCLHGYVKQSGDGLAVCKEEGKWDGADLVCREIDCGQPPTFFNAEIIWNGSTNLGSNIQYKCIKGFYSSNHRSVSRCTLNETWEELNFTCRVKEHLIVNITIFNETCLQWRKASEIEDWVILYKFSIHGTQWHQKNFVHKMNFGFSTKNTSQSLCMDLLPGVNYTVIMIAEALELQEILTNVSLQTATREIFGRIAVFNTTCLQWIKSSGNTEDLEDYTVFIKGHVWNKEKLIQNIKFNLSTGNKTPVLCLQLPPGADYVINVTEISTGLSASVPLNISMDGIEDDRSADELNKTCLRWNRSIDQNSLQEIQMVHVHVARGNFRQSNQELLFKISTDQDTFTVCLEKGDNQPNVIKVGQNVTNRDQDPLFPKIQFISSSGQLPRMTLQRNANNHVPISSYQVFVIHLGSQCYFTCESLESVTYFNNISKTHGYITAEFYANNIPEVVEFSIGDRQYYGDFYNAPLSQERDYCIILRTVSTWNKVINKKKYSLPHCKIILTSAEGRSIYGLE
ncbi:hypothetical protein GDO86_001275 [Hymenochirus boettgeri]|uniref:Sushi domain containing 1 n=1 Tax=Hymenochirus boettgeri TaxID=247094 RepID=A0A8T2KKE8_9PIPI|nr:hypothetical protein GDO86_001275 [Hymenochirus boettgeri]